MRTHHHKRGTLAQSGPTGPTTPTQTAIADEDIRRCPYQKWEAAGKPAGDGVQFWLEAERELVEGEKEKFVQGGVWHGHREQERVEAEKAAVKERPVSVDSHYRDNNRMFQSHGERGHRHGGSG